MKQVLKTLFLVLSVCISYNLSSVAFPLNDSSETQKEKRIDLRGELSIKKTRSAGSESSITASVENKTVLVSFLDALQDITINIYNSDFTCVYHTQVYVSGAQQLVIPLGYLPNGEYLIEFVSPRYGHLSGEFTL